MDNNDLENLIRLLALEAVDDGRGLADIQIRVFINGSGTYQIGQQAPIAFVGPNTFAQQIRNAIKENAN